MTYFTVQTNFLTSVLTYGVVFGIGCGIAYPTPITCALRWFPDHPGLICGLIFLGFGMGSIIFNQVITFYLNPANLLPDLKQHDDIVSCSSFIWFHFLSSTVDKNTDKPRESNSDVAPLEMLRTRQFYFLWFLFLFGDF
nr:hypothetical protein BaRGS_027113 [Batillaria attramentaria]